ncbi:MAG: efflux RND transporter permease subunit [Sinobacteraceae bacterium]|nr:efflux RND transporter permease subunit [Nevskiaceae bacterium]
MSVSEPFIRRPIATSLLMAAVLLLGALGYRWLPISALPSVDFPTIEVTTLYPGASPSVMSTLVTTPLEREFGQIAGLTAMTSNSSFGVSTITLQFALERNIDDAAQDVQSAINAARGTLPSNLPYPPSYSKVNPADAPILSLAITSDSLPIDRVNDFADTIMAQKLSQVSGVGLVTIEGNQKPAVRVQANPAALAGLGLGLEDLRAALTQANVNAPKGSFNGATQAWTVGSNDQIGSADEYRPIIVAYRNDAPVRLSDVAAVFDGVENDQLAAWVIGEDGRVRPAVLLDIQRQPGANIIQTVDRIRALLPQLQASVPAAVKISILSDRTQTIRASVHDVQQTLLLTVALVVLVIFLFLRKLWATAIPSVALPLSLIGTFGVMAAAGFSLDNLSLMALTIATGFVVDDAIVMIENIVRYLEQGHAPEQAARIGAQQIGFTVISLTVSLVAVFIPLLLMSGIVGRLFREFALVLTIAVVLSALVSLSLTPMMCAKLLRPEREDAGPHWLGWSERWFRQGLAAYERSLRWVLRHRFATLMVAIATLAFTILLYVVVPKGLIPVEDTGLITGITEAAQSISFPAMVERSQALAAVVRRDPDVQAVSAFVGAGTVNPTLNTGRINIVLKPRAERRSDIETVIERIKRAAANVPGITLYLQPVQDLQIDSRIARTQYQYVLQDSDREELRRWAPKLLAALQQRPELADVASDQQSLGLELKLTIDRDKASRLGVPVQTIDDTLYDAFGQRQVTTIYTEQNQYRVILEVPPDFRARPDALDKLYVRAASSAGTLASANAAAANAAPALTTSGVSTSAGDMVPLSAVAHRELTTAPLVITHQGQLSAVTISFNLAPGYSLGAALDAIDRAQRTIGLPGTITAGYSGSAAEFQSSLASEPWLILAAVVVIYIVLGVLYESYIHPITILSTLPSAGVGALLALILTGQELSIVALIGIVLLIGIVKKNAIMMIDFALDAERLEGRSPEDSIFQAALLRFRPIMMTTMAALLGALPLALQSGTGSELRKPLGIAIVGGLLLSQVLTLYTTPVIYLYMDRLAGLLRRRRAPAASGETAPAPRG